MNPTTIFPCPAVLTAPGPFRWLRSTVPHAVLKPGVRHARMYIHDAKHGDTCSVWPRLLIRPADWKTLEKLNAIADALDSRWVLKKIPVELIDTEFAPANGLRPPEKQKSETPVCAQHRPQGRRYAIAPAKRVRHFEILADGSTMTLQPRGLS